MASRDIRRIVRKITLIGKRMTDAVERELLAGADEIVAGQKARAPRKTGKLASTIHHSGAQATREGVEITIRAGGDATTDHGSTGRPGGIDYAVEQEFGNQHMAANPFFYPEVREKAPKIRRKVRNAFRKEVHK